MGIVGAGNTAKFDAAQVRFLKQAGVPLVGLMQKTNDPEFRLRMARLLRVPIENCVASKLGVALYKSAMRIGNNNSYDLGEDSRARIMQLQTDYLAKQKACDEDRAVQDIIVSINAATNLVGTSPR
jgi:hypothetical protein